MRAGELSAEYLRRVMRQVQIAEMFAETRARLNVASEVIAENNRLLAAIKKRLGYADKESDNGLKRND